MIVSDAEGVLFVHVQKTGGSSVERILLRRLPGAQRVEGLVGDRHASWKAAVRSRPELAGYFTFGFVRNPWDRLFSWYRMIERRRSGPTPPNWFMSEVLTHLPTFERFVLDGPERYPRLRRTQLSYLEHGGRRADLIGRTEHFARDLGDVAGRLGLGPLGEIPRTNVDPLRSGRPYRDAFTPQMRDHVAQVYARDIEAFGYDF